MLIKCPECNKEISDKAISCPNCGCPINNIQANKDICIIDGKEYDFTEMMKLYNENRPFSAVLYLAKNYSFNNNKKVCPYISIYIENNKCIPREIDTNNIDISKKEIDDFSSKTLIRYKKIEDENNKSNHAPHCPTCNSTNVQKISTTKKLAGAIGFGLLSKTAKSQFECKDCGYKW